MKLEFGDQGIPGFAAQCWSNIKKTETPKKV